MLKKISAAINSIRNPNLSSSKNLKKQTTQRELNVDLKEVYCGKKEAEYLQDTTFKPRSGYIFHEAPPYQPLTALGLLDVNQDIQSVHALAQRIAHLRKTLQIDSLSLTQIDAPDSIQSSDRSLESDNAWRHLDPTLQEKLRPFLERLTYDERMEVIGVLQRFQKELQSAQSTSKDEKKSMGSEQIQSTFDQFYQNLYEHALLIYKRQKGWAKFEDTTDAEKKAKDPAAKKTEDAMAQQTANDAQSLTVPPPCPFDPLYQHLKAGCTTQVQSLDALLKQVEGMLDYCHIANRYSESTIYLEHDIQLANQILSDFRHQSWQDDPALVQAVCSLSAAQDHHLTRSLLEILIHSLQKQPLLPMHLLKGLTTVFYYARPEHLRLGDLHKLLKALVARTENIGSDLSLEELTSLMQAFSEVMVQMALVSQQLNLLEAQGKALEAERKAAEPPSQETLTLLERGKKFWARIEEKVDGAPDLMGIEKIDLIAYETLCETLETNLFAVIQQRFPDSSKIQAKAPHLFFHGLLMGEALKRIRYAEKPRSQKILEGAQKFFAFLESAKSTVTEFSVDNFIQSGKDLITFIDATPLGNKIRNALGIADTVDTPAELWFEHYVLFKIWIDTDQFQALEKYLVKGAIKKEALEKALASSMPSSVTESAASARVSIKRPMKRVFALTTLSRAKVVPATPKDPPSSSSSSSSTELTLNLPLCYGLICLFDAVIRQHPDAAIRQAAKEFLITFQTQPPSAGDDPDQDKPSQEALWVWPEDVAFTELRYMLKHRIETVYTKEPLTLTQRTDQRADQKTQHTSHTLYLQAKRKCQDNDLNYQWHEYCVQQLREAYQDPLWQESSNRYVPTLSKYSLEIEDIYAQLFLPEFSAFIESFPASPLSPKPVYLTIEEDDEEEKEAEEEGDKRDEVEEVEDQPSSQAHATQSSVAAKPAVNTPAKVLILLGDAGTGKSVFTRKDHLTHCSRYFGRQFDGRTPTKSFYLMLNQSPKQYPFEAAFRQQGFTEHHIQQLRQTEKTPFLMYLDGYDEWGEDIQIFGPKVLREWVSNPNQPRKVIVTCRSQYLQGKRDYKTYFTPNLQANPIEQAKLLQEQVLTRLDPGGLIQLVDYYVEDTRAQGEPSWHRERYLHQFHKSGIEDLVRTPIILLMALEVLPLLERQLRPQAHIQRLQIYQAFMAHYLKTQRTKLIESGQTRQGFKGLMEAADQYATQLALRLFEEDRIGISYEPSAPFTFGGTEANPWDRFFNPNGPDYIISKMIPLRVAQQQNPQEATWLTQYSFIHKSMLDYYVAKGLYHSLPQLVAWIEHSQTHPDSTEISGVASPLDLYFSENGSLDALSQVSGTHPVWVNLAYQWEIAQRTAQSNRQIAQRRQTSPWNRRPINEEQVMIDFMGEYLATEEKQFQTDTWDIETPGVFRDPCGLILSDEILSDAALQKCFESHPAAAAYCLDAQGIRYITRNPLAPHAPPAQIEKLELTYNFHRFIHSPKRPFNPTPFSPTELKRDYPNSYLYCVDKQKLFYCNPKGEVSELPLPELTDLEQLKTYLGGNHSARLTTQQVQDWISKQNQPPNTQRIFKEQLKELIRKNPDHLKYLPLTGLQQFTLLTGHTAPQAQSPTVRFKQYLIHLIQASRTYPALAQAAANAATLWARLALGPWINLDFSKVCLKGADLTATTWDRVSLVQADLSETTCRYMSMRGCDLNGVQFLQTRFGELPWIKKNTGDSSITISPQRPNWIVIAEYQKITIYDRLLGKTLFHLTCPGQSDYLLFSPKGDQLAACGKNKEEDVLWLWDLNQGSEPSPKTLCGHTKKVRCLSYAPDGGQLASGSGDNTVLLWDPRLGSEQSPKTLSGHTDSVICLSYAPNGRQLASGSRDRTVRLWDPRLETEQSPTILNGHTKEVTCLSYAPDGGQLASGGRDHTVQLWDPRLGTEQSPTILNGHTKEVACLSYAPDGGQLASGSEDHTMRLWDPRLGSEQSPKTLSGHTDSVICLSYAPDGGQLASGSRDHTVQLWDPRLGERQSPKTLSGHTKPVTWLSYAPDGGQLVSGSEDNTVRLWDLKLSVAQSPKTLSGHTRQVTCLSYAPDGGQLASGSRDNTVRLWDPCLGIDQSPKTLSGHTRQVICLSYAPDGGQLASGSWDHTVRLWNPRLGAEQSPTILNGHTKEVTCLSYAPEGGQLASGSNDDTVCLWNLGLVSEKLPKILRKHTRKVTCLSYAPDSGQLALGNDDGTVHLWNPHLGADQSIQTLNCHMSQPITCLSYAPDGGQLASGGYTHALRLWNLHPKVEQLRETLSYTGPAYCLSYAPDGEQLAVGCDDYTVRLLDLHLGSKQSSKTLLGHTKEISCLSYAPDGEQLASGSQDGTVRLWDTQTKQLLQTLRFRVEVRCLSWQRIGHFEYLAVGDESGQISCFRRPVGLTQPFLLHWAQSGVIPALSFLDCHFDDTNQSGLSSSNQQLIAQRGGLPHSDFLKAADTQSRPTFGLFGPVPSSNLPFSTSQKSAKPGPATPFEGVAARVKAQGYRFSLKRVSTSQLEIALTSDLNKMLTTDQELKGQLVHLAKMLKSELITQGIELQPNQLSPDWKRMVLTVEASANQIRQINDYLQQAGARVVTSYPSGNVGLFSGSAATGGGVSSSTSAQKPEAGKDVACLLQ